jgi:hypothetical protein
MHRCQGVELGSQTSKFVFEGKRGALVTTEDWLMQSLQTA